MFKSIYITALLMGTLSLTDAMPVEPEPTAQLATTTISSSSDNQAHVDPAVVLKQATRDEIIARANRPEHARRAAPSPTPAPDQVLANPPDPDDESPIGPLYYKKYYQGSGVTLNDDNPGNDEFGFGIMSFYIPGTTSQQSAIEKCADNTWKSPDRYYSFQLYYDSTPGGDSQDTWICKAYDQKNSDTSYFNVVDTYASPVFGYSF
ncbi:hypothetical protein IAT40_005658 [Kwoniella sp. CBS 6097]